MRALRPYSRPLTAAAVSPPPASCCSRAASGASFSGRDGIRSRSTLVRAKGDSGADISLFGGSATSRAVTGASGRGGGGAGGGALLARHPRCARPRLRNEENRFIWLSLGGLNTPRVIHRDDLYGLLSTERKRHAAAAAIGLVPRCAAPATRVGPAATKLERCRSSYLAPYLQRS